MSPEIDSDEGHQELTDLRLHIRGEWLLREIQKHFGPESSLAAGQHPYSRFKIRSLPDRYIISDEIWPSEELILIPGEIDQPGFCIKDVIKQNEEWSKKELTPDSEDVIHTARIIRRLFCKAVEGVTSSLAGIRHADRFEVQMRKDTYIVRDQLHANVVFEIPRNELFEPISSKELLSKARRESADDANLEEEIASQESTRATLKVCLEMFFGPEAAVLAQMDPGRRFTIRDHNGGFRIFDSCNPSLWLTITAAEVKCGELDIELMYERATPTFWTTWEQEQKGNRNLIKRLIWKRFMDHYEWPLNLWQDGRLIPRFEVNDYRKNYEINDWALDESYILTQVDLHSNKWGVLEIITRTYKEAQGSSPEPVGQVGSSEASESDDASGENNGNDSEWTESSESSESEIYAGSSIYLGSARPTPKRKAATAFTAPGLEIKEGLERTAGVPRDFTRKIPKPVVVEVEINGKRARALIDSGSLADFMSTTLADQLQVNKVALQKPLQLQLAVHGSRSKINFGATAAFRYQEINDNRSFDIANLDTYDIILGTPFLYQYQVMIGLNPTRVFLGSKVALPIEGESIAVIQSAAAELFEEKIDELREKLKREAEDLSLDTNKTNLPPLRSINHTIPIIDENKVYSWRPSKCPEAMRPLWNEKKNAYLKSGRWQYANGSNASPLLIIPKPPKEDGKLRIRTVVDKREQNANTRKMTTPLPDIDTILRNVVKRKYRSLMDGKDAYEQIRIVPEHVRRTLFTTPDGTMESLVLQQGDCNGPATYQSVMNYIFAPYIGVFMDVYLDDIIVYSDSIEDHVKHLRIIFNVLRKEKLYLSSEKMDLFANRLKILGHVIDENGITMDPHKVDRIQNWKVPTNKTLLSSFLGAVGFLASDCRGVRIPMAVLSTRTGATKQW
jgi:hypothetical protein